MAPEMPRRPRRRYRAKPIVEKIDLGKKVTVALLKYGTLTRAQRKGFFPEYSSVTKLRYDATGAVGSLTRLKTQIKKDKAKLASTARKAIMIYGSIEEAFKAGFLPGRFKRPESFLMELRRYGILEKMEADGFFVPPIKPIVRKPELRVVPEAAKPPRKPAPAPAPKKPALHAVPGKRELPVIEDPLKGVRDFAEIPDPSAVAKFLGVPSAREMRSKINSGAITERHPPSRELLLAVGRDANYNQPLILYAFRINTGIFHEWLKRTKCRAEFGREAKFAAEREKKRRAELKGRERPVIRKGEKPGIIDKINSLIAQGRSLEGIGDHELEAVEGWVKPWASRSKADLSRFDKEHPRESWKRDSELMNKREALVARRDAFSYLLKRLKEMER